jgi:hypothetical protein
MKRNKNDGECNVAEKSYSGSFELPRAAFIPGVQAKTKSIAKQNHVWIPSLAVRAFLQKLTIECFLFLMPHAFISCSTVRPRNTSEALFE